MNIPVFLASDDNYAPFVATTIASMCDNTKSFINFYILDGGISKSNKKKIENLRCKFTNFSLEFIQIDVEKEFPDFEETDRISKSMYSRFLIPSLKPDLDKVIYSDIDVVALGDVSDMFNEDLNGYAVGAVWEEYLENSVNINRKKILNISDEHKYFCSGHLLMDCNRWRNESIISKLLELASKGLELAGCPDQDILNIYFDNNYKVLNPEYGVMDIFYEFHNIELPVIRHFHGKVKPWHIHPEFEVESFMPNHKDFWYYLKATDFYSEILDKVLDKDEQSKLLRQFKVIKINSRSRIKKKW